MNRLLKRVQARFAQLPEVSRAQGAVLANVEVGTKSAERLNAETETAPPHLDELKNRIPDLFGLLPLRYVNYLNLVEPWCTVPERRETVFETLMRPEIYQARQARQMLRDGEDVALAAGAMAKAPIPTGLYSIAESKHAGYQAATASAAAEVGPYLKPDGTGDVLITCAGTGIDTRLLASLYPKAHFYAVEADPEVGANLLLNLRDLSNVTVLVEKIQDYSDVRETVNRLASEGTGEALPSQFDAALITFGVDHFPEQGELFFALQPLLPENAGFVIVGEHIAKGDPFEGLKKWHEDGVIAHARQKYELTGDPTHLVLEEAETGAWLSGFTAHLQNHLERLGLDVQQWMSEGGKWQSFFIERLSERLKELGVDIRGLDGAESQAVGAQFFTDLAVKLRERGIDLEKWMFEEAVDWKRTLSADLGEFSRYFDVEKVRIAFVPGQSEESARPPRLTRRRKVDETGCVSVIVGKSRGEVGPKPTRRDRMHRIIEDWLPLCR